MIRRAIDFLYRLRPQKRQAEWQTWPTMHFDPKQRARLCAVITDHEVRLMEFEKAIAEERRLEK